MKTYIFYKDNRIDQRFELTVDEIKQKYFEWAKTKDIDWIQYYGHQTVAAWIADKEGLSSVVDDPAYYADLQDILIEVRHKLY